MTDLSGLTPEERSKRLLERLGKGPSATPFTAPPKVEYDADLIPEQDYDKSPEDKRLDGVLNNIDILDAYVRLIGKMQPEVRGSRTEGIKISCPMPNHPDADPSAWINTEKQTWFCGGCQIGGDVYDLAAIHFGYDLATYKSKADFPVLRKQLAEKFGYVILPGVTGEHVVKAEPEVPDEPASPPVVEVDQASPESEQPVGPDDGVAPPPQPSPSVAPPQLAPVRDIFSAPSVKGDREDPDVKRDLQIDWVKILPYETYFRSWMEQTTVDDLPHEFYFGLGLQALAFAGNRKNIMLDFQVVRPNLFLCLYGKTGLGKSRSMRPYLQLLEEVMPFTGDKHGDPQGVRILPTPGSGEAVIDSFRWDVIDSSTNQYSHTASVTGLVRHEELSGMVARAARQGSSLKEVFMEMYDVHGGDVTTHSRTSGISTAHDPFCQMISTTQPNAIHAFLRRVDIESGFLNRFLYFAGVPRVAPIPYGGVVQDITDPVKLLKNVYIWAFGGHEFVLQGEALEAWTHFFNTELAPFKSGQQTQESIFSRIDLQLKKIIICLTLDEMRDQPTGDIVERAVMLYPYLLTTYGMFASDITFNDVTDCQRRIVACIEKSVNEEKVPPTKRDLTRMLVRKFDGETVVRALRNLTDLGLVDENATVAGVRGRPTIRYVLPAD